MASPLRRITVPWHGCPAPSPTSVTERLCRGHGARRHDGIACRVNGRHVDRVDRAWRQIDRAGRVARRDCQCRVAGRHVDNVDPAWRHVDRAGRVDKDDSACRRVGRTCRVARFDVDLPLSEIRQGIEISACGRAPPQTTQLAPRQIGCRSGCAHPLYCGIASRLSPGNEATPAHYATTPPSQAVRRS